jgi:hypothetical protein
MFRKKWIMVLPRYRLFPCRNTDENPCYPDQWKSRRHECGDARRDSAMPLPRGAGKSLAQRRNHARKSRAVSVLFCCRSPQVSQSAPGAGSAAPSEGAFFSGDGSPYPGRVYSVPAFKFRAVGRKNLPHQKCNREPATNRSAFRSTRSKKNDPDCGAHALKVLNTTLKQLSMDTSPAALFPQPPIIRFSPSRGECSCGVRLLVQKAREKKVWRMTGPIIAHETVKKCPDCGVVLSSDTLRQLVPVGSNVAYDVMVVVGKSMYQRHKTTEEIRAELATRNVHLCASEIDYLARAHRRAIPRIRKSITLSGGYILHLDATHAGDAPALMTGLDSLSRIVLPISKSRRNTPIISSLF